MFIPNLSGKKLDVIPYGTRVTFISEQDEELFLARTNGKWTKVKWGATVGWVYSGFLSDLHPDKSPIQSDKFDPVNELYSDKQGEPMALCRAELDGYGFTLSKDGSVDVGG